jgi:SpoVK/Ycf46/Vps4 family AAA+-type ATPase
MNKIAAQKKWSDVLPDEAVKHLLHLLDGYLKEKQLLISNKELKQTSSFLLFFYGGDKINRKAAAALAGMHTRQDVHGIDLSSVVSKYIGETEKNLSTAHYIGETEKNLTKTFADAKNNNWVLFFDEADALFGKRTEVKDAHDRYANFAVNLMQQIENSGCPVILSGDNAPATSITKYVRNTVNFG